MFNLLDPYKGISSMELGNRTAIMLWEYSFSGSSLKNNYSELYTLAKNQKILLSRALEQENLHELFHLLHSQCRRHQPSPNGSAEHYHHLGRRQRCMETHVSAVEVLCITSL